MAKSDEEYWHPIEGKPCRAVKFKPPGVNQGYIFGDAGRPYPNIHQAIDNTDLPMIRLPDGRTFRTRELLAQITPSEYYYLERERGATRPAKWRKKPGAIAKYSMKSLLEAPFLDDDTNTL